MPPRGQSPRNVIDVLSNEFYLLSGVHRLAVHNLCITTCYI